MTTAAATLQAPSVGRERQCRLWAVFADGVLMQYLLFRTLPEGRVETESIFMSVAAVGSSLMVQGCRSVLVERRGRTPEARDEGRIRKRRSVCVEERGESLVLYILTQPCVMATLHSPDPAPDQKSIQVGVQRKGSCWRFSRENKVVNDARQRDRFGLTLLQSESSQIHLESSLVCTWGRRNGIAKPGN